MSEEKTQKLKEYQKERYRKAKESRIKNKIVYILLNPYI